MKRNAYRINVVAGICASAADINKGLTTQEIMEATGFSRSTVGRILQEPGFSKSKYPLHPVGHYFNSAMAIAHQDKPTKVNTGRDYRRTVHTAPAKTVIDSLSSLEALNQAVVPLLHSLVSLQENVTEFKNGGKLDSTLVTVFKEQGPEAIMVLETYMQFIERIQNDPRLELPDWWCIFDE